MVQVKQEKEKERSQKWEGRVKEEHLGGIYLREVNMKNQWRHNELHLESCQTRAEGWLACWPPCETNALYITFQCSFGKCSLRMSTHTSRLFEGTHIYLCGCLECRVSFCRSPFVYFPLCWGFPLLTTLLTSPAAYQYISRPCSVLTRSMPHKAIYSSFLVPYSFTLSSSLPRHPDSSTSNRRTRRCKEVQKASAIFPYGHASAEPCTHAEQTMQVNMHIL